MTNIIVNICCFNSAASHYSKIVYIRMLLRKILLCNLADVHQSEFHDW